MIPTVRLTDTSLTSHSYFFCVGMLKICSLNKCQLYNMV